MSIFKLILIILGVCFAIISQDTLYISLLINVSLITVIYLNRHDVNIVSLCLIFLIVKITEEMLFTNFIVTSSETMSSLWVNTIIFSTHLIVDITLILMVMLRAPYTRGWLAARNKPIDKVRIYRAEVAFVSLFFVFMLVDLAALLENFIRHLDEIGFSKEIAEIFSGWNWIYYQYENIKSVLTGLSFLLIWSMTIAIGKEEYQAAEAS